MKMREFTKDDWMGFGGAEPNGPGNPPLMFEAFGVCVVLDANGIIYHFWTETDPIMYALEIPYGAAKLLAEQLTGTEAPFTLTALGFQSLN